MSKTPWIVAGAAVIVLAAVLFSARPAAGGTHPDPRPGITAERVLADVAIPHTPGATEAYAAARAAAGTLDGVYCHCDCSKHAGHRSLLTCFETNHGAYCDICMGEAMMAAQMASRGTSLQEIRAAIDAQFGT
ncbi:MAG TPA: CYCXC family (seleno)protein [Gemmatimonadales bacterium]|nr:CYCXC family (seleno)protein [Gemmatimonadales bacterium]